MTPRVHPHDTTAPHPREPLAHRLITTKDTSMTSAPARFARLASRGATLAAIAALALTGCAAEATPETADPGSAIGAAAEPASIVTITDPWIKTVDTGMTAAFGVVENPGDEDLVIVSATSSAATSIELHETVDDGTGTTLMQEVDGGFTVPAGGTHVLEPGGDHLMLMGVDAPILAGDEVEIILTFSTGETLTFTAIAKDYAGANEEYGDHEHEHGDEHADGEHDH